MLATTTSPRRGHTCGATSPNQPDSSPRSASGRVPGHPRSAPPRRHRIDGPSFAVQMPEPRLATQRLTPSSSSVSTSRRRAHPSRCRPCRVVRGHHESDLGRSAARSLGRTRRPRRAAAPRPGATTATVPGRVELAFVHVDQRRRLRRCLDDCARSAPPRIGADVLGAALTRDRQPPPLETPRSPRSRGLRWHARGRRPSHVAATRPGRQRRPTARRRAAHRAGILDAKPTMPCWPGANPVPKLVMLVAVVDGTPHVSGSPSAASDAR